MLLCLILGRKMHLLLAILLRLLILQTLSHLLLPVARTSVSDELRERAED